MTKTHIEYDDFGEYLEVLDEEVEREIRRIQEKVERLSAAG